MNKTYVQLHVYMIPPIDFWHGWLTAKQYAANVRRDYRETYTDSTMNWRAEAERDLDNARAFISNGKRIARRIGWEGDVRSGPFVAALAPSCSGADDDIMIAWKQDNNGTTFIVSPHAIPWLESGIGQAFEKKVGYFRRKVEIAEAA